MRTKVIFIAGVGHSGSTLLDLVLGSHSKIESVGEVRPSLMRQMVHGHYRGRCTCGMELSSCGFWTPIFKGIRAQLADSRSFLKQSSRAPVENALFVHEVLGTARRSIYLESTKGLQRLDALTSAPSLDVHVLHLVRDGRAVAHSYARKGRDIHEWARVWASVNREVIECQRRFPGRWLTVRYEDFALSPRSELARIMRFAGEQPEPDQLSYRKRVHHNLLGNRMRRDASDTIALDAEYLDEIGSVQWQETTRLTEDLLVAFGYPLDWPDARTMFGKEIAE